MSFTDRLPPDALLTQAALTGSLSDVTDDPDSPDTNWLLRTSDSSDTILRTSFPIPPHSLTIGANLQEFRVLCRRSGAALTPTVQLFLYENGTQLAAGAVENVTVQSVHTLTWNASLLSDPTGAGVEVRAYGTHATLVAANATVEYGAVEWNFNAVVGSETGSGGGNGNAAGKVALRSSGNGSGGGNGTIGAGLLVHSAARGSQGGAGVVTGMLGLVGNVRGSQGINGYVTAPISLAGPILGSQGGSGLTSGAEVINEGVFGSGGGNAYVTGVLALSGTFPIGSGGGNGRIGSSDIRIGTAASGGGNAAVTGTLGLVGAIIQGSQGGSAHLGAAQIQIAPGVGSGGGSGQVIGATIRLVTHGSAGGNARVLGILTLSPFAIGSGGGGGQILGALKATGILGSGGGNSQTPFSVMELCVATGERVVPEVILDIENLNGDVDMVRDDPDMADVAWLAAVDRTLGTQARTSFYTPTRALACGTEPPAIGYRDTYSATYDETAGTGRYRDTYSDVYSTDQVPRPLFQEFRVLVRPTFVASLPPLLLYPEVRIDLFENGVLLASSPTYSIASPTIVSWMWNAALLTDPTGANVECRVTGIPSIFASEGWTIEIGAIEWNTTPCGVCVLRGSGGGDGTLGSGIIAIVGAPLIGSGGANARVAHIAAPLPPSPLHRCGDDSPGQPRRCVPISTGTWRRRTATVPPRCAPVVLAIPVSPPRRIVQVPSETGRCGG